ncbi:MAG: hypothetical protein P8P49_05155 [Opitutales bacterium]|nr:hypothetical protein [Opitutales bacterium]
MKSLTSKFLIVFFICLTLSSCIEFENQEIVYEHDIEKDELRLVLRYKGIFGNLDKGQNSQKDSKDIATKESLNEKQIEQLESVINEKRAFFFTNWIFEYSPKTLPQFLEETIKRNDNGRFGKPEQDLIKALIENIELQNIGFHKNGQGQLCGAQTLRIQNFSEVLNFSNRVIRRQTIAHIPQLREELAKGEVRNSISEENIQFLVKKMKDPYPFIQIDGNLLSFQFPNLYPDSVSIKQSISNELPKGTRIIQKDRNIIIAMGTKDGASGKISKKCFDGYWPNAKNYMEENHKQLLLKPKLIDQRLQKFLTK